MAIVGRIVAPLFSAVLFVLVCSNAAVGAGEPGPHRVTAPESRAEELLKRAVAHVAAQGANGVAAFNREARFVDRDLYVYALRMDGMFLASGGFSSALIGSRVLDYTDTEGKPFFQEMIELARRDGGGRVEYKWYNPADSRGDSKVTLFRKVGDIIVAVGYFTPHATPVQAKAMLHAAAQALQSDQQKALADFQRIDGRFIRDDLYVFAVDLGSGLFVAHGATPSLVGTHASALQDPDGRHVVTEMIERLRDKKSGELDYVWMNPVSGRTEAKHSYFRRVGAMLVGVGYYNKR